MTKTKASKSAKSNEETEVYLKNARAVPKGKHQSQRSAEHANGKSLQPQTELTTQKAEKPSAGGLPGERLKSQSGFTQTTG